MVLPVLIRAGGQIAAQAAKKGAQQSARRRAVRATANSRSDQSSEKEKVNDGYFSFALILAVIFDGLDILLVGVPVAAVVSPLFLWMFYSNRETRHLKMEVKFLLSIILWIVDIFPWINFVPALIVHVTVAWLIAKKKAGNA